METSKMNTIAEIQKALHEKKISSVELVTQAIAEIEKLDKNINAVIHINKELALKKAEQADNLRSSRNDLPLLGIPILHKDIFVTQDMPTTCGSKMLSEYLSPFNATVVDKCENAGMINIGKTNMDEFAMGSSNETSHFGIVRNPWNYEYVPGGSSGGSAASVAAGYTLAATASDTGGSIRQPASLCGVTGFKPTYGRISRYGMIAFSSSLDQGGTITKTAHDSAIMLNALQGHDVKDATSSKIAYEDFTRDLNASVKGLTIGLPKQFFESNLDGNIAKVIMEAVDIYQKLGAKIIEVDLPSLKYSIPTYYIIQPAEASSNLARFDGIRYGYRSKQANNLEELYMNSRHDGFGMEVKRRVLLGTFVLSSGHKDAFYQKALEARSHICNDFNEAFKKADVLLGPTSPTTAFKINQRVDDPISMYLSDIFTIGVNMAYLPAISIPCGLYNDLPVGLQLITPKFQEALLFRIAHQYQLHTNWHQIKPSFIGYPK